MRVRCRLRQREAQRARLTLSTSTDSSCRLALTSAVPIITLTTRISTLIHRPVLLDDIAIPPSLPLYTPLRFSHERAVSYSIYLTHKHMHARFHTESRRKTQAFILSPERARRGGVTHKARALIGGARVGQTFRVCAPAGCG